jgi:Glycosyltransferase family 87
MTCCCARAKSAPPETRVTHIIRNVSDIEPNAAPTCAQMLDSRLVSRLCGILLVVEIALFLFLAAGTYGLFVPLAGPTTTDFVSFYAAGDLANAGTPALAYDRDAHYAAEERATAPGIVYNFFYYPPIFLLLCGAVARLPYLTAFVIFEATTFGFYFLVLRNILGERSVTIVVPLLAFPPVLWTIGLGQNGFLTAGLFGAATLLIDRRPAIAGLLFGALCVKPHFALMVPVALAAGGRWRAFAAAFACAAILCLLSLVVFGWPTWHAFLTALPGSQAVYASGRIPFGGFVTPFGAAMLLGATGTLAGTVQAGATVAAAVFVAWVWRRGLPLPIRAASLVSATLVAVPLALFYDLVLAGVAAAWLLRGEAEYRLPEWGKVALAALYVLSLNPRGIAAHLHFPAGPLTAVAFAALVATVAFRGRLAAGSLAIDRPATRQPTAVAGA